MSPDAKVLTVRQLNEAIQGALLAAFPAPVWVRGEIQRLPADAARRKHVYFELHEARGGEAAAYQVPIALLGWDRDRFGLGRYLDGSDPDLQLRDQLEVCFQCRVDFYPPYGKVQLRIVGVDPFFTLGRLEARRREVLAALKAAGLLALNRSLPLADLPLRVGLITSAGSAAERDFRSGLTASGYPFAVDLVDCRMQGDQTAPQVVQALVRLAGRAVDVVVITRGGGSRADLSWFDQQALCEAIARCPVPVVTGIGHEIDRSLADEVAHTSCKTPTAAAELLVGRVRAGDDRLRRAAGALATAATAALRDTQTRLAGTIRLGALAERALRDGRVRLQGQAARLDARVARRLAAAQRRLAAAAGDLRLATGHRLAAAGARTRYLAGRLEREAAQRQRSTHERLKHLDDKVRLLDPARLLERGYTLTLDASGRLLRAAGALQPGDRLRTRFADGHVDSTVTAAGASRPRRKGAPRGGEEDPGQQALF